MDWQSVIVPIVKQAGQIILNELKDIQFTAKSPFDILAKADVESEKYMLAEIYKAFPTHSILSEEKGDDGKTSDYKWIVDPLDGTINFSQGLPDFCTSLALLYKKEIIFGLTYQPILQNLYIAELGKGSTLNGQPIHVASKTRLMDLIGSTESSSKPASRLQNFQSMIAMGDKVKSLRISGSAALNLARVAAGNYDFYFNHRLNIWDVAAGSLLISEAGGIMTDLDGQKISMDSKHSIASNMHMYEEVRAIVRSVLTVNP